MRAPSTSLCGSCLRISLSLQVPGSDSSELITRYEGLKTEMIETKTYLPSETLGMKEYLSPEGKPAPPLPLSPDFLISSMIQSWPISIMFFV